LTTAPSAGACGSTRGELDKIIERSNAYLATYGGHRDDGRGEDDDERGGAYRRGAGRGGMPPLPAQGHTAPFPQQSPPPPHPHGRDKRKSFWEEMFD
jgi:hypothetical protein